MTTPKSGARRTRLTLAGPAGDAAQRPMHPTQVRIGNDVVNTTWDHAEAVKKIRAAQGHTTGLHVPTGDGILVWVPNASAITAVIQRPLLSVSGG